jgi:hypothetical protein
LAEYGASTALANNPVSRHESGNASKYLV